MAVKNPVRADTNYSIPIFATGNAHWHIVRDVEGSEKPEVVCSVMFPQADPEHPDYEAYMAGIKDRVENLVKVINNGLSFQSLKERLSV